MLWSIKTSRKQNKKKKKTKKKKKRLPSKSSTPAPSPPRKTKQKKKKKCTHKNTVIRLDQFNVSFSLGAIVDVRGTKFDLTEHTDLGKRIPEVPGNFGFDHTFCLEKSGWKMHVAKYVQFYK